MNLLKRKITVLLLIFLIFTKSYALETDTHKIINKYVAGSSLNGFSLNKYLITDLGIKNGINKVFLGKKIFQCIADGGLYEDKPPIGPPYLRSFNHFHDPIYDKGYKGLWKSSIIWSQLPKATQSPGGWYSWHDARWYFYHALTCQYENKRNEYWEKTFRALGQLMHLVQDASVPAHVRDDGHPFGFHYEKWVGANHNKLILTPKPFDKSIVKLNLSPLAPVPISNIIDTNQYSLSNLNYAQTWVNKIGISEFTNANFLSEDTIFKDYPHPAKENTNANLIEQTAKDGKKDRAWYIKGYTSEKLAAYSYLNKWLLPDKWTCNLDSYVYQDYASQLIPRAVGYSAGLLNYFFRGDINMVPHDSASGFVIENNSDEDMSGTFELWYDDAHNRKKTWSSELNIGKKSKSTNISSALPAADKYILVFQGKMGNEDGAVVGKIIEKRTFLFLVNIDQQVISLEIKTGNNQYELIPLSKKVNIKTSSTSSQLIIQSHPDQNEHVVIKPYSAIMYKPQIKGFGVRSAIGTQYVYRPQSFSRNSPYRLYTTAFYPIKIYSYRDLEAVGRKSYTLSDDKTQMVSYGNSIWKKILEPMTCTGNYQEEGRTCSEKEAHYMKYVDSTNKLVNGPTLGIDEFFTYEHYAIDTTAQVITERTEHDFVATISNDKAIYKKNLSYWEWDRTYDFYISNENENCCSVSITNLNDEFSNEVNLVVGDTSILSKTGEGTAESVHTYWRWLKCAHGCKRKTIKDYVLENTQYFLDVMDYDNLYNDENIILFYKVTEQFTNKHITDIVDQFTEPIYSDHREDTLTTTYHFYYKSNSITNSIDLPFVETYHSEYQDETTTATRSGERVTGVSSQINDKNIVYTYVAEKWNEATEGWSFIKRIIGIINRDDPRLAAGYRQEFEINGANTSDILTDIYADYDYKDLAAIGVHIE